MRSGDPGIQQEIVMHKYNAPLRGRRLDFRCFAGDRSGVIAIWFALVLTVPLTVIGGAIDFKRWYVARQSLVDTLDIAILAAARTYQTGATKEKTRRTARRYFVVHLPRNAPKHRAKFWVRERGGETKIIGQVETDVRSTFLRIIGIRNLPVEISAEAVIEGVHVEVAAMLDLSNSMTGPRLSSLKTATRVLIRAIVKDRQNPFTSRVGLVPFATHVNVGHHLYRRVAGPKAIQHSYTDTVRGGNRYSCIKERRKPRYRDLAPARGRYFDHYGGKSGAYALEERTKVEKGKERCPIQSLIMPLSGDRHRLLRMVDGLEAVSSQPGGTTAGHLGTQWTWYVLSPKWNNVWGKASAAARPYPKRRVKPKVKKVAILMTDGDYTRKYSGPDASRQAIEFCKNMKKIGITIYTVGFLLHLKPNPQRRNANRVLRACASSKSKDFRARNGAALISAFKEIAARINTVRIAK